MRAVGWLALAALLTPTAVAHADLDSTATINGEVPPGVPAKLVDPTVVTDTVGVDGDRLLVIKGIRKAGTRAPIQYHDHGGHACVLTGTVVQYVDGAEPAIYPAGSCYDLEPRIAMSAANIEDQDAELRFTFVLPVREPSAIVIEPDWPDLADPTG